MVSFKKGDKEIVKSINFDIGVKRLIVLLFSILKLPGNIVSIIFVLIKIKKEIIV